jgi:transposase
MARNIEDQIRKLGPEKQGSKVNLRRNNLEPRMSQLGHSRLGRASSKPGHVRCSAESGSKFRPWRPCCGPRRVDDTAVGVIQSPKPEPQIMRYELSDYEWAAIKPMLPNKPRGVPRVNDRRVLNGIFWVLCSGAPWRDLPDNFGPYTTCYNRFVRWRRAGVWGGIMNALAATHDAAVQMIDTSIVRVHQHAACIIRNKRPSLLQPVIFTVPEIWLSASSTRSNSAAGSLHATTSSRRTISPSSSLHQSGCGCALMSPRPRAWTR